MRTVLFPTDFSMNSIHAIRYGLELFKGEEMNFILFNAYTDPSAGANMSFVWEDHMQMISKKMLGSVHELLIDDYGHEDFTAECVSQFGDLPHALDAIVEQKNVDLIIMGASGASSEVSAFFGSKSYATMKKAKCPVLTVPLQCRIKAPSRIGLASETKLTGEEEILRPLNELAMVNSSWVMGLRVDKDARSSVLTDEEEEYYEDIPDLEFIDLNDKDPLIGIESAIGTHRIDMLAIILKKRSFLDRIFHKSVSKQLAKEVALPILTLHEESA